MKKVPLISVENVSKQYDTHTVFDDISFEIKEGEFIAMIGPNGAGKTTLIRLLLGLEKPTSGVIHINGKSVAEQQHKFGYIPQRFDFDRTIPLTVLEFMSLIKCNTQAHICHTHMNHVLKEVGLSGTEKQKIGTLSGGQMQRLLIARALTHHRPILLLDEPAAGIDIHGEQQIYDLLKKINKQFGTTCIVVSHELDFVFAYAQQVLCINRRLLCHGSPKRVLSEKVLQDLFGKHKKYYKHTH